MTHFRQSHEGARINKHMTNIFTKLVNQKWKNENGGIGNRRIETGKEGGGRMDQLTCWVAPSGKLSKSGSTSLGLH